MATETYQTKTYYKGKRRKRVKEKNAIGELKKMISEFEAEKENE